MIMKKILVLTVLTTTLCNADFIRDSSKEIVIDTSTNLIWQDNTDVSDITHKWDEAIQYCENLNLAGQNNWHLPNINELYTLVDRSRSLLAMSDVFKNNILAYKSYWSSTTCAGDSKKACIIYVSWQMYSFLSKHESDKEDRHYTRCVRLLD